MRYAPVLISATLCLILGFGLGNTSRAGDGPGANADVLPAAEEEAFPGHAAYLRSLADAETTYVKEVLGAREAYVQAIKDFMMRASMMREQAQQFAAEIERIEGLPKPTVDPEPEAPVEDAPAA